MRQGDKAQVRISLSGGGGAVPGEVLRAGRYR